MNNKAVSPEELISDTDNFVIRKGVKVRKGTVGAALANADILISATATDQEKQLATEKLAELAPALAAIEISKHVTWKNPVIEKMIAEAEKNLTS